MFLPELAKNTFFHNMNDSEITSVFHILHAKTCAYSKDSPIFFEGDMTDYMGIVLHGSTRIERIDYQGNRSILAHIGEGEIFAESYALLSQAPLMVDVVANSDCQILFLNLKRAECAEAKAASWYSTLIMNLLKISNRKNLALSSRSFHTFSRHVRGRILSYLQAQAIQHASYSFDIPFNRQQMADYLNVDRSALSNELCKMRDEGLLVFRKNHFELMGKYNGKV